MKIYTVLFCCLVILGGLPLQVYACNCSVQDESFLEYLEKKHVFMAYSTDSKDCNDNNKYEMTLNVIDNYKGKLPRTITAYTDCATSCSFKLDEGVVYLFFTNLVNNNIDFCELRIRATDDNFVRVKDYLDVIKATKLDYVEVKGVENQVIARAPVFNGKVNGLLQVYYPDGKLRIRGMFIKGQRNGNFEINEHTAEHHVQWKGDYKNGERHGKWIHKKVHKLTEKPIAYILYEYEDGEIVDRKSLDKATQIELYTPK